MKNTTLALFGILSLVILGAGCQRQPPEATSGVPEDARYTAPSSAKTPEQVPIIPPEAQKVPLPK